VDGNPQPIWSICFSTCPAFDFPKPLAYSCDSSLFTGTSSFVLWSTIPVDLPSYIYYIAQQVEEKLNLPIGDRLWIVEEFLKDFY
jgi:hypothetical protein